MTGYLAPRSLGSMLFCDFCKDYASALLKGNLSPLTIRCRMAYVAHLSRALGVIPVGEVRAADVSGVVRDLYRGGKRVTARRVLLEARDIFSEAAACGMVEVNPAMALKVMPAPVVRSRLSLEHYLAVCSWAADYSPPWFAYALRLALVTGQRRGDLVRLCKTDVWDGFLHVSQQKTGSRVALPLGLKLHALDVSISDVLAEADDYRRPGVRLLRHAGDRAVQVASLTQRFSEAIKAVFPQDTWGTGRTPPTFHELRSLSERLYRQQGVDTQTLLGHSRQTMTDIYNDSRGLNDDLSWRVLRLDYVPGLYCEATQGG